MSVTLDQVVPWGRSLEEYKRMFMLSEEELNLRIYRLQEPTVCSSAIHCTSQIDCNIYTARCQKLRLL